MPAPAPGDLLLPRGFWLGCATAAHQVEGGCDNDWADFEAIPGRIRDGSRSGIACDHWNRWPDDLRTLAGLGQNAHRLSVEWSRIEPREGVFDDAALAHYAAVVAECRRLGMEPFVTLLHFTLPRWLAARGGVRAADAPPRFARLAAVCAERLGDRVEWWVTVNEPVVQVALGYLYGEWPPGLRSFPAAVGALRGLLRMHAAATAALRASGARHRRPTRVGVAHHVRGMLPNRAGSWADRAAAAGPDWLLNRWWLHACRSGRMLPPVGAGGHVPGAAGSLDWIGLNYYCDDRVRLNLRRPGRLFADQFPDPRRPRSTCGWAIDPDGLRRVLVELWEEHRLPIVVTENGVADVADELRPRYLVDHLAAVHAAIAGGVDVRGYLHWTSMDNFEWAEGYGQRFGLFAVDRASLERRPKPSTAVYERICRAGAIPADLLATGPAPGVAAH